MDLLPKNVPNLTDFHRAWNKLLDYIRGNTPISSADISVTKTPNGLSLSLNKRGAVGMEYDFNSLRDAQASDSSLSVFNSRIASFSASYGTDAPVWNATTAGNGFKKGTIVRVLPHPINDLTGDIVPSQVDQWHMFKTANVSSSTLWNTDCIYSAGLISRPGSYICVCDVPQSNSYWSTVSASGQPDQARNPNVCYAPLFPEPATNAAYFGNRAVSGSLFENYQGRYWECLGLFQATSASAESWFRGAYDATYLYKNGDGTLINMTSSNGGLYFCVQDLPNTGSAYAPTVGAPYWVQLSTSNTRGSWN